MKIVWSKNAKKEFSKAMADISEESKQNLLSWAIAQLPGPISKKNRQQKIIFGYALAITAF